MRSLLGLVLALPLVAASVDGIRLHWSSAGSGKRTVVLVHGWTCDESAWSGQAGALGPMYRTLALDLPGHGRSGAPQEGQFSMELFARAVEAVRAEAKAGKIVLVGHSMGTPVIRQYARMYPERVAALVFVDGRVRLPPGTGTPDVSLLRGPDGLKAREKLIRGMLTPAMPAALGESVVKMMLAAPEATATGAMRAMFDPGHWKDDFIEVPVLGIYAEKSRAGDPAYSRKHFPKFEYVEIPGSGHFLMMEKPEEFNRLLVAFLDKLQY